MRREFPDKVRLAAFERAAGQCEQCTAPLLGRCEYDHRIPDALGGAPTLENCVVLCHACHGVKTHETDVPTIAKSKRVRKRHAGIRKQSTFRKPPPGYDSFRRQWRDQ